MNVRRHQEYHDAFNRRDWQAIAAMLRGDIVYVDEARGITFKGAAAVMEEWVQGWSDAFSDGVVESTARIDGGDHSVIRFRARGTNDGPLGDLPATNRRLDLSYCEVLHWDEDGKIEAGWMYYDQLSLLSQLGHVPPQV